MFKEISFDAVKRLPQFSQIFHDTIVLQHNNYYLFNRQHNLEQTCEYDRKSYYPLNQANLLLGKFCKKTIVNLPSHVRLRYPNSIVTLNQTINDWQDLYNTGGVFDTCRLAKKILENLELIGIKVHSEILSEKGLAEAFMHIPFFIKSFFQLSFLISDDDLESFFEKTIQELASEPSTSYYIKEFKVSYKLIGKITGPEIWRIVKINLLPSVVVTKLNPVIGILTKLFSELLGNYRFECLNSELFSLQLSDQVCISQGNSNYKLFLEMLGLIDNVYDKAFNYALIKN